MVGYVRRLQWKSILAGSIDAISKFWPTQGDEAQRKIILKLLAEEEATLREGADPEVDANR